MKKSIELTKENPKKHIKKLSISRCPYPPSYVCVCMCACGNVCPY